MTTSTAVQIACPHCHTLNRLPGDKPPGAGKCGKCGNRLFDGRPVALNSSVANRHLASSDLPVLVDFWAPWCGPCRIMAPVFEEAAARLEPRMRVAKIDTEAEPQLAQAFTIRSIPTLVLMHKGNEIARTSGAMPLNALLRWVEQHVV